MSVEGLFIKVGMESMRSGRAWTKSTGSLHIASSASLVALTFFWGFICYLLFTGQTTREYLRSKGNRGRTAGRPTRRRASWAAIKNRIGYVATAALLWDLRSRCDIAFWCRGLYFSGGSRAMGRYLNSFGVPGKRDFLWPPHFLPHYNKISLPKRLPWGHGKESSSHCCSFYFLNTIAEKGYADSCSESPVL